MKNKHKKKTKKNVHGSVGVTSTPAHPGQAATRESGGPKAVVDALPSSVWWLNPDEIDVEAVARARGLHPADVDVDALKEAAATTYSLDDDNFTEPTFNAKVKDYGMADPDVYEPLAEDPWCGDDPPSSED